MKHLITKILISLVIMIVTSQVNAGVFNNTICSGSSIVIGNTYPGATLYQWNSVPPQYTPQITVNPTTNTSYIVNVFAGVTWMLADTFNITVNPLPSGTITPSQSICAGASATLTATGGVSYLWSPGGATTSSITVSPSVSTTYSVLITGSNGCCISLTSTVTVNPLPVFTAVGSNSPLCEGSTLNLTAQANAGSSYAWTGPNGFTSNLQNPSIANVSSANAGTYNVTATLNGCSSTTASTVVVVNPVPIITAIGSNSPLCEGSTLNLTAQANAGSSYAWTGPNGFTSNLQNPSITNVSTANAGTYNVVATLNGCSSSTVSTVVVVNTVPVITYIGSNSPICSGNSITLNITATPGSSYAWTGPNGFSSNLQNPTIPNASTANSGNYNCVVSLGGCSTSANTAVIVNIAPVISTIGNNGPLCVGFNLSLYAAANAGSTYNWTGPSGFTSNLQNPVIPNVTTANAGTYFVTATLNGCTATANTNVTVNAAPIATITGNMDVCNGSSTTLTASGGGSYLWSNGATTASITVSPFATTTYSVVVTATGGCNATAFATVVVNPIPVITITSSNNNICEGENVILNASGGGSYLWSNGATTASIIVSPSATTTYSVTGTMNNCSGTKDFTLVVNSKPNVSLNLPQSELCVDANPLTLTGGNPVGGTYYGEGIHNGLFYPSTVGVGTYNIHYEYTNSSGCKSTATKLLTVNPLPTVIFNAISPNPVPLGTAAFQLNTGIPLGGSYSGPGVVNGWFHPSIAGLGQHTISYTYTDFKNCVSVAMQTIKVEGYIGIEEVSSSLIRIYPNPALSVLNIEMEEIPNIVQIFDMTGKSLLTEKVNSKKFGLDVSHLSKGVYFIRFIFEDGSMGTAKFVK